MHGDEPQSVGLIDELAMHLRSHPEELAGLKLVLVRSPNPDGLAGRTSVNSLQHRHQPQFSRPESAPDALTGSRGRRRAASWRHKVMVGPISSEFRPNLVVHLKDSRDQGKVNAEGACQELADARG